MIPCSPLEMIPEHRARAKGSQEYSMMCTPLLDPLYHLASFLFFVLEKEILLWFQSNGKLIESQLQSYLVLSYHHYVSINGSPLPDPGLPIADCLLGLCCCHRLGCSHPALWMLTSWSSPIYPSEFSSALSLGPHPYAWTLLCMLLSPCAEMWPCLFANMMNTSSFPFDSMLQCGTDDGPIWFSYWLDGV